MGMKVKWDDGIVEGLSYRCDVEYLKLIFWFMNDIGV